MEYRFWSLGVRFLAGSPRQTRFQLIPEARRRVYIIGLNTDAAVSVFKDCQQAMNALSNALGQAFRLPLIPIDHFLEDKSSLILESELSRRSAVNRDPKKHGRQKIPKWITQHKMIAKNRKWKWPFPTPRKLARNPWFKSATLRERELIVINEADGYTFFDTSQSAHRVTRTRSSNQIFTLLPGAHVWSKAHQRYLVGTEFLALQGLPANVLFQTLQPSEAQKKDFAGNSFSSTVMIAIFAGILGQSFTAPRAVSDGISEPEASVAHLMSVAFGDPEGNVSSPDSATASEEEHAMSNPSDHDESDAAGTQNCVLNLMRAAFGSSNLNSGLSSRETTPGKAPATEG
eukprot:Skav226904  [mRNA]  locus=scaffold853:79860:80894:+ [translate_table: standard]